MCTYECHAVGGRDTEEGWNQSEGLGMRALLLLIFVCIALGAYGCDSSGDRQGRTAANSEVQPHPDPAPVVDVREPEPPLPGFTQEVFAFKGIPLGKPDTSPLVLQLCERIDKNKRDCTLDSLKSGGLTFQVSYGPPSGLIPLLGTFKFADDDTGTLEQVEVWGPGAYMEELAEALTTKYGAPMGVSAELQNLYGATQDSQLFAWEDPEGNSLIVTTLDPSMGIRGYGRAKFKSANLLQKEIAAKEARREAAIENL